MATQYPVTNDNEFSLLKKLVQNTALLADEEAGDVTSVNGRTGAVTLTKTDVGLDNVTNAAQVTAAALAAANVSLQAGYLQSNSYITVDRNGSDSINDGANYRLANAAEDRQLAFQLNAANGCDLWALGSGGWTKIITISASGDILITDTTRGFVLTAPNASKWRITVNNAGLLATASI